MQRSRRLWRYQNQHQRGDTLMTIVGRQQKDIHLEPAIDFILTYPCYSPMRTSEEPCTCHAADGTNEQAVLLITDSDLVDVFFETLHLPRPWLIETFTDADRVIDFLEYHSGFAKRGIPITHVVIDPGDPSKYVRSHLISEFVRHIAEHD